MLCVEALGDRADGSVPRARGKGCPSGGKDCALGRIATLRFECGMPGKDVGLNELPLCWIID